MILQPLSTVFQSYQDKGWMIMKGCVQINGTSLKRSLPQVGFEPGAARSEGEHLSHRATGAPLFHQNSPLVRALLTHDCSRRYS